MVEQTSTHEAATEAESTTSETLMASEPQLAMESGDSTPSLVPAEPFNRSELARFEEDDIVAGGHIGKMLAVLFLYTVIVMGAVALWTVSSL